MNVLASSATELGLQAPWLLKVGIACVTIIFLPTRLQKVGSVHDKMVKGKKQQRAAKCHWKK